VIDVLLSEPTVQDVAILDFGAPAKLAEVRELSSSYPTTRLLLLGHDPTPVECAQALAFGASACLGGNTQSRDVINAIHLASRGAPGNSPDSGERSQRSARPKRSVDTA
jgi:DNA-binding NarL/FixJ family response regulator